MTTDTCLSRGDTGARVQNLQQRLNRHGAKLEIDGIFGAKTAAAVRTFQHAHQLVEDGVAGPITTAALLGVPPPPTLRQADIDAAATHLDCDPAAILAVMQVEAPGTGYLPDGRLRILFERHLMYRDLKAAGIDPAPYQARWPDIVNPKPGGYLGGNAEYGRLAKAKSIHIDCALSATSWGRFQILGAHAKELGYAAVADFVAAMQSGPLEQLRNFCKFVALDPEMHRALQAHDWPAFAAGYNGPDYAENHYAKRLALAWAQQGGRDKAVPAVPVPPPPADTGGDDLVTAKPHRKRAHAKPKTAKATA